MRPVAWFSLSADSPPVALGHGAIIGRLPSAQLQLEDGRISEAHAMVSLRGRSLVMLALRGRFSVGGRACVEAEIREGLSISLADGIVLTCLSVELPESVLGLETSGATPHMLVGTTSLVYDGRLTLRPGYDPAAAAIVWGSGGDWHLQVGDAPPRELAEGDEFDVGGVTVRAVGVALSTAGVPVTVRPRRASLRVEPAGESVNVTVNDRPPAHIGGTPGRLLSALAAAGEPLSWSETAARVWVGDQSSADSLRRRFDATVARARRALRELGVHDNVIVLDRAGSVRLIHSAAAPPDRS